MASTANHTCFQQLVRHLLLEAMHLFHSSFLFAKTLLDLCLFRKFMLECMNGRMTTKLPGSIWWLCLIAFFDAFWLYPVDGGGTAAGQCITGQRGPRHGPVALTCVCPFLPDQNHKGNMSCTVSTLWKPHGRTRKRTEDGRA